MFSFFYSYKDLVHEEMRAFERIATDTISHFVHMCTAKVNKYARKGSVCSLEVHSTLSHNKIAFPFENLPL